MRGREMSEIETKYREDKGRMVKNPERQKKIKSQTAMKPEFLE